MVVVCFTLRAYSADLEYFGTASSARTRSTNGRKLPALVVPAVQNPEILELQGVSRVSKPEIVRVRKYPQCLSSRCCGYSTVHKPSTVNTRSSCCVFSRQCFTVAGYMSGRARATVRAGGGGRSTKGGRQSSERNKRDSRRSPPVARSVARSNTNVNRKTNKKLMVEQVKKWMSEA